MHVPDGSSRNRCELNAHLNLTSGVVEIKGTLCLPAWSVQLNRENHKIYTIKFGLV